MIIFVHIYGSDATDEQPRLVHRVSCRASHSRGLYAQHSESRKICLALAGIIGKPVHFRHAISMQAHWNGSKISLLSSWPIIIWITCIAGRLFNLPTDLFIIIICNIA